MRGYRMDLTPTDQFDKSLDFAAVEGEMRVRTVS
jgi:hypothetical protein